MICRKYRESCNLGVYDNKEKINNRESPDNPAILYEIIQISTSYKNRFKTTSLKTI